MPESTEYGSHRVNEAKGKGALTKDTEHPVRC